MRNLTLRRKLRSLFFVSLSGLAGYSVISFCKNDPTFYKHIVMPLIHLLDPEKAHRLAVVASKYGLIPKSRYIDPNILAVTVFGKRLKNPIGIAAGFDKDGEAIQGLKNIGFGFVEIGSVTPEPQPGNPKPRVFRLSEDQGVINRYGFNSQGHDQVLERLEHFKADFDDFVGVNLGKNKDSCDAINDYVVGIKKFAPIADYLVINVSSPNTPGLRSMQDRKALTELLKAAVAARNGLPPDQRRPLLLKLAPDLNYEERKEIAKVIQQEQCKVDGLIVSNTTVARPEFLVNKKAINELGGLSGKPLKDSATEMIADLYRLTKGRIPIVGVGGIFTGQDAYDKIAAGASVVQIYTSVVYEGPPVVTKIKKELCELLAENGHKNVAEAVGKNVKL